MDEKKSLGSHTREYLHEIDLIRAITVFSVVSIHSLSYTSFLISKPQQVHFLNLVIHLLHFNREMFMFVTGLVLTYVYFSRPFSAKRFWFRRALFVLIPYLLWTLIYVILNNPGKTVLVYLHLFLSNSLTGDASFQLYYILLSLQFYVLFPLYLLFLKKVAHHPWTVLGVSLLLQLGFLYFDFHYLQTNKVHLAKGLQTLVRYQDRIVFVYQFFFILGSIAAIYMSTARAFLTRHGRLIGAAFLASIALYTLYYYAQLDLQHLSIQLATTVLQPSVVLYSTVVIAFFTLVATRWSEKVPWHRLVKAISDASFGIYFVHVLILSLTTQFLLPLVPSFAPVVGKIILVLLIAFSLSVIACLALLRTRYLSWTIGRARR